MTPKSAWEQFIPKDKVIHEDEDFFQTNKGDIIVSNPPFTLVPKVLERLVEIGKPFMLIMPVSKMCTQYFRKMFANSPDPKQRIHFQKTVNGEVPNDFKSSSNFDCFYYCWKMGLKRDVIWLDN